MTIQWLAEAIALPTMMIAILLGFIRLVRGPSLPDRVVAFDLLATIGIAVLAVYAMSTGKTVYLDVGLVLALVAFLGTVAFAFYIQRGA